MTGDDDTGEVFVFGLGASSKAEAQRIKARVARTQAASEEDLRRLGETIAKAKEVTERLVAEAEARHAE